ncbi:MAG: ABC transporter ATP-binding protein [Rhodospirillales bacterium]|nr:ABC transporter ATP-binding protein [Rhodospirillales bacterium]
MSLLVIEALGVSYGRIEAVRDVSLVVEPGQIATVIGPNGAGKTSMLGAIMGLHRARGRITYGGTDLRELDVEDRVERGLCLVPERRELFGDMSVFDNLQLGSFCRRLGRPERQRRLEDVFTRFPRLKERRAQLAKTLSGGEQQMLALGRALMSEPKLLMLDEPSLGLAPFVVRQIFAMIAGLREAGVSILLVEQNARAALQTADVGYVLETGELVHHGPAAELIHDPRLIATYLGGA